MGRRKIMAIVPSEMLKFRHDIVKDVYYYQNNYHKLLYYYNNYLTLPEVKLVSLKTILTR